MSSPTVLYPNVTAVIEPSENEIVHFLRCAPAVAGDDATGLLNLRIRITNNGSNAIRINEIKISIPGTAAKTFSVNLPALDQSPLGVGSSISWNQEDDYVFAIPQSPRLKLEISADGFPQPAVIRTDLVPHVNPTPTGSYRFWGRVDDLEPGEYWQVHGTSHAQTREQMFAYDVGVGVSNGGEYDLLKSNTNGESDWGSRNEHHRIWGKSIYAVAAGEVTHWLNDFPGNQRASGTLSRGIRARIDAIGHGNGNFFTITTGNETILYAHMQEGSLNEDLLRTGAQVDTGDFLGLAGNSGASSRPHLHIHANRSNTGNQSWADLARPMVFRKAAAVAWSALGDFNDSPWARVDGLGMPTASCAVWPAYPPPRRPDIGLEATIDPLALVLTGTVYVDLTLPDPPPFEAVRDRLRTLIQKMSPAEKKKAMDRLKALGSFYKDIQHEFERKS